MTILGPNSSSSSAPASAIAFTILPACPFTNPSTRGFEKPLYYASNSLLPSNDVYLAFLSADITRSYFSTLGKLIWGMATAAMYGKPEKLKSN